MFIPQACRSRHDESKPKYDYGVVIPHKSSKSTENSDIHTSYKDVDDQPDKPGGVVLETEQQIRWVFDEGLNGVPLKSVISKILTKKSVISRI